MIITANNKHDNKRTNQSLQPRLNSSGEPTITTTFSDMAENGTRMQRIGEKVEKGKGYSVGELKKIKDRMTEEGYACELINLNDALNGTKVVAEPAAVLIIKKLSQGMLGGEEQVDKLFRKMKRLNWDKNEWQKGKVVNLHARYKLCFSKRKQRPNYAGKKGRIIAWKKLPLLNNVRKVLPKYFGAKAANLQGEGNFYFNKSNCYIRYHGDAERRKVIAFRFGASMPLHFQWFYGERIAPRKFNMLKAGPRITRVLEHGDAYIMSEKAVGTDWRRKVVPTLHHAAGTEEILMKKSKNFK
jgi:hypothetical protein